MATARPLLESYDVADRVETVGGNFFEKVPEGSAVYILKDILHDWNDDVAARVLRVDVFIGQSFAGVLCQRGEMVNRFSARRKTGLAMAARWLAYCWGKGPEA